VLPTVGVTVGPSSNRKAVDTGLAMTGSDEEGAASHRLAKGHEL
jgi:hypothetical protein